MRSWSALVVCAGFSLWGCSDEAAGSGLGPDTSWQVGCADPKADDSCSTSEDPHGPVGGTKPDVDTDDQKLRVTECSFSTGGLQLTIEDPGVESDPAKGVTGRSRSVLTIGNGRFEDNKCLIEVVEYPRAGGRKRLIEACEGNTSNAGTCVLEGERDSNGYAFEGTLKCDGMMINGQPPPDFNLRAARKPTAPVVLQITDC
jgi:hypothetical protein